MVSDLSMVFLWYGLSLLRGEIYPNVMKNEGLCISVLQVAVNIHSIFLWFDFYHFRVVSV